MKTVLVANRGEIAVRIIKTLKALGIHSVQVFSDADEQSLAVRLADESIRIGPPQAAKSYLDKDKILEVALAKDVDAIHPGYGFLSENAEFARGVEESGIKFLGPASQTIEILGDKVEARKLAVKAGVPVVPGTSGAISDLKSALLAAEEIGFPVMIKAAAGGGGRGIRIAQNPAMLEELVTISASEAKAAFGDGTLYLEKLIENARHIEVQFMGDGENYVHCYERECSTQRRRQKVWEEAPAIGISEEIRKEMCEAALALAKSARYVGVGTVEFLYDSDTKDFYFIEVNTRIQVEHPVTELITNLDIVKIMLEIAENETLPFTQGDIKKVGHAIECRINAEDPFNQFFPSPGNVEVFRPPIGEGVRFDGMLYEGYSVPPYYDSLLGKLIVWGQTREIALARMEKALNAFEIQGIKTTIPLHLNLLKTKEIKEGTFDIKFLEEYLSRES